MFRVQTVPAKGDYFSQRVSLHKDWRGLRKQELESNAHGLKDIEFVHHSGFIGGAWSLETAIQMAVISIEAKKIEDQEKADQIQKPEEDQKIAGAGEPRD